MTAGKYYYLYAVIKRQGSIQNYNKGRQLHYFGCDGVTIGLGFEIDKDCYIGLEARNYCLLGVTTRYGKRVAQFDFDQSCLIAEKVYKALRDNDYDDVFDNAEQAADILNRLGLSVKDELTDFL